MKKLFIILLLITSNFFYSQVNLPVKVEFSEKYNNDNFQNKETWLQSDSFYIIKFNVTPVAIKNCFKELEDILTINNLSINSPAKDLSLLASYVKDFKDYQMLSTSLIVEDSDIKKIWKVSDNKTISLTCNKSECYLLISR